jgi:hypothetical protein
MELRRELAKVRNELDYLKEGDVLHERIGMRYSMSNVVETLFPSR